MLRQSARVHQPSRSRSRAHRPGFRAPTACRNAVTPRPARSSASSSASTRAPPSARSPSAPARRVAADPASARDMAALARLHLGARSSSARTGARSCSRARSLAELAQLVARDELCPKTANRPAARRRKRARRDRERELRSELPQHDGDFELALRLQDGRRAPRWRAEDPALVDEPDLVVPSPTSPAAATYRGATARLARRPDARTSPLVQGDRPTVPLGHVGSGSCPTSRSPASPARRSSSATARSPRASWSSCSLERIERFDPQLNAFGAVYAEQALAQADAPAARAAVRRPDRGQGRDGHRRRDHQPRHGRDRPRRRRADSEVVRRLRDAGAIVVGKTKMPELGLWPFTESITWGVTRNPWDTDRTPGGSSGGSAAAVAAGLVPAAVAADGAGSIRIPAACCGLFGLKPHSGRVPRAPHDEDGSHWICFGGLTRSVADSALMLDVMAPGHRARRRAGRCRIAYSEALPARHARQAHARDARTRCATRAELLRDLGHEVVERDPDFRARDVPVIVAPDVPRDPRHRGRDRAAAAARAPHARNRPARARWSRDRTVERLLRAERRIAERVGAAVGRLRRAADADAVRARRPGAGRWRAAARPSRTCGRAAGRRSACSGTRPASRPRRCPPGSRRDGLPLAVQLVGRPHGEGHAADACAAQIEAARPWVLHRPRGFDC